MSLGSGIRIKPIPDPGVQKAPDPGSGTLPQRKEYREMTLNMFSISFRNYATSSISGMVSHTAQLFRVEGAISFDSQ
jgi:hypothetical protein